LTFFAISLFNQNGLKQRFFQLFCLHFLGYRHGLFFASQFVPKLLQPGLKRFDGQSIDLYSFGSGKEAGYNAIPGKLIDYNTYDKYLYKAVIEITEKNIKND
jgi:hypothetical protein